MQIRIIFDSVTGNTRKVADAILSALPISRGYDIDILNIRDYDSRRDGTADLYFIGFWIRRGSPSVEVLRLVSSLHGKKIALFGTCGLPAPHGDYEALGEPVRAFIPDDSTFLGTFVCRGRMEIGVRNCCEAMRGRGMDCASADRFLASFDEAMLHPDAADLQHAAAFARKIIVKAGSSQPMTA